MNRLAEDLKHRKKQNTGTEFSTHSSDEYTHMAVTNMNEEEHIVQRNGAQQDASGSKSTIAVEKKLHRKTIMTKSEKNTTA